MGAGKKIYLLDNEHRNFKILAVQSAPESDLRQFFSLGEDDVNY